LRGFDFVALFLGDGPFHVLARDGQWVRARGGLRIGEAPVDIFGRRRREFGTVGSD